MTSSTDTPSTPSNSTSLKSLKIASRESPLALWQSEFIKASLEALYPELRIEIVGMTTKGDQILDVPLAKVGGKGLFVKELETSLLNGETDIAVHSMKDVPMEFPEGLGLPVICERHSPFDAFVSNKYDSFDDLPKGAILGTSSLRRKSQLQALRPDLDIKSLRGNVQTRLSKLDAGEYDAIILAESGLRRLELDDRVKHPLDASISLPAAGQGALGIECRLGDQEVIDLLKPLIHEETMACVSAERAMNRRLEGGCQVPIGGYATLNNENVELKALVASLDGSHIIRAEAIGKDPEVLGKEVAEVLLKKGAAEILKEVYGDGSSLK